MGLESPSNNCELNSPTLSIHTLGRYQDFRTQFHTLRANTVVMGEAGSHILRNSEAVGVAVNVLAVCLLFSFCQFPFPFSPLSLT